MRKKFVISKIQTFNFTLRIINNMVRCTAMTNVVCLIEYDSADSYGQIESIWKADQSNAQQTSNGPITKRGTTRRGSHQGLH